MRNYGKFWRENTFFSLFSKSKWIRSTTLKIFRTKLVFSKPVGMGDSFRFEGCRKALPYFPALFPNTNCCHRTNLCSEKSRVRKMIRDWWLVAKVIFRHIMARCHSESSQMTNQKSFWLLLKLYINVIDNVIKTTSNIYHTLKILRMMVQYVYDLMFRLLLKNYCTRQRLLQKNVNVCFRFLSIFRGSNLIFEV